MKTWPDRVSVVIPVYNGTTWLAEAIDSALSQTWPNTEVVVVNDGSTDSTTERIARSYGDQIHYVQRSHGGVAAALNAGIEVMSGRYFSWLSHDDRYLPGKVERQMNALAAVSGEAIAFGDIEVIDQHGRFVCRGDLLAGWDPAEDPLWLVLLSRLNGCTLLVPRMWLDAVGRFDEGLPHTQDYDLWFRLAQRFPFLPVLAHDVESRQHPAQGSQQQEHRDQVALLWRGMLDTLSDEDLCRLGGTVENFFEKLNRSPVLEFAPAVSAMIERRRGVSLDSLSGPEARATEPREPAQPLVQPESPPGELTGISGMEPSMRPTGSWGECGKRIVRGFLLQVHVLRVTLALAEVPARFGGASVRRVTSRFVKGLLHLHGRIDEKFYSDRYGRYAQWSDATLHYLRFGRYLGWSPHPDFDHERFLELFPGARDCHLEPLSWLGIHRPDLLDRPIGDILGKSSVEPPSKFATFHARLDSFRESNSSLVLYLYTSNNELAAYWAHQLAKSCVGYTAVFGEACVTGILELSVREGGGAELSVPLSREAGSAASALQDAGLVQVTIVGGLPDCPQLSGFLDALGMPMVLVVTDVDQFSRPWGRSNSPRPQRDAGRCDRILTPHSMLAAELVEAYPGLDILHANIMEQPDPYRYRVWAPRIQSGETLRVAVFDELDEVRHRATKVAAMAAAGDDPVEFACVASTTSSPELLCGNVRDLGSWAATDLTYALCAWGAHVAWFPRKAGPVDHLRFARAMLNGMPIATIDTPYVRSLLGDRPGSWRLPNTTRAEDWLRFFVDLCAGRVDWNAGSSIRPKPEPTSSLYVAVSRAV